MSETTASAEGEQVTLGLLSVLAVTLAIYQLWQPLVGFLPPGALPFESVLGLQPATYFRPTHLTWVLCLGFLLYPLPGPARVLDWIGAVAVL